MSIQADEAVVRRTYLRVNSSEFSRFSRFPRFPRFSSPLTDKARLVPTLPQSPILDSRSPIPEPRFPNLYPRFPIPKPRTSIPDPRSSIPDIIALS